MSILQNAPHLRAVLLLLIAMLSLQSSGSMAKLLFDQFPILTVSAMRLLLSALVLMLIFQLWNIQPKAIRWPAIFSYGAALAGMNMLFYLAIDRLPLGIAVSFEFIGPLSVALFYARRKFDFIWVGLAIVGLVLLFAFDQTAQPLDGLGVLFALGAGACWALYIVAGQKPSGVSGNHTVCLGMLVGTLILLPIALWDGLPVSVFEPGNFIYFIALAVLASALPFSLEMIALRNLTALSFGTLMSMEPAIAALSGFVFLGEQLLWNQWLALSTIIAASIGCTYTVQQRKQQSS
ncbi:EamA family transporter [Acinetobacter indicus]|uniref:EamA family transporter n=1 Tax=Acinetobacter indicus TaxID=756892 RepID=UPI000FD91932|nr:EamA family transporter [Acinetobacter indicus]QFS18396.1 EamA family transporter [Acinetobacter indicus]RVT46349.1 EamA family transporter [Acinetobacter indicus]UNW04020.1 EamA family transporter [Acinetobacter indicus]